LISERLEEEPQGSFLLCYDLARFFIGFTERMIQMLNGEIVNKDWQVHLQFTNDQGEEVLIPLKAVPSTSHIFALRMDAGRQNSGEEEVLIALVGGHYYQLTPIEVTGSASLFAEDDRPTAPKMWGHRS
jgi:hypothetical protein